MELGLGGDSHTCTMIGQPGLTIVLNCFHLWHPIYTIVLLWDAVTGGGETPVSMCNLRGMRNWGKG